MCSTMHPPLHLEVILPIIGSFFSYASTSLFHPLIFWALLADTRTSPFLSSILSSNTEIFSPILILSFKPLVFVGLLSYSLYLWHYPIFSFIRLSPIDINSTHKYLILILLIVFVSIISYYFVEQPFRNNKIISTKYLFIYLTSIILIISNESKWGRSFKKIEKLNQLNLSLALSLVAAISLYFYANNGSAIIYISAFVGFLLMIRYLILLVFNTYQKKHINIPSMLAHMGLGMLILSVSANSIFSSERVFNMYPNDIKTYRNISISFDDLQLINNSNHDSIRAVFKVVDSNGKSSLLYPEKRKYFVRGQITSETAIKVTPLKDIYITIGDQLDNKSWVVNVQLNYFIRYVWFSAMMMELSGLIIVISSYRSRS